MGEAKRRKLLGLNWKPQSEEQYYDRTSVPGMVIKHDPEEAIAFRLELNKPENRDLYEAGIVGKTFSECIGNIAAKLSIHLSGEYDGLALLKMLTTAMQNRGNIGLATPYLLAAGLKPMTKDMMEQDVLALFDFGETYGTISPAQSGNGPYTICDSCVHSFDCITARACEKGTPAIQLENTMKVIDVVVGGKGSMH